MTDSEIIELLGGGVGVANLLGIKPPSVSDWLKTGIPDLRMIQLGAQIEIKSEGRFSRCTHWPDKYAIYWPELAPSSSVAQKKVA